MTYSYRHDKPKRILNIRCNECEAIVGFLPEEIMLVEGKSQQKALSNVTQSHDTEHEEAKL